MSIFPLRPRAAGPLAIAAALLAGACGDAAPGSDAGAASPADLRAPAGAAEPGSPAARLDLDALGHSQGAAEAPVTVVEFSDFGCPYCAKFGLESYPELKREFVESGQVRWQFVPFELGIFPNGGEAALAAECAAEQEQFWPMHDLLYQRQREWKQSDSPADLFLGFARDLGLDAQRFSSCYGEKRPSEVIERNNRIAGELGVRATPSFLINGRPVEGALPLEQFRMLLQWAGAQGR